MLRGEETGWREPWKLPLHTHTDLCSNPQLEDTNLHAYMAWLETLGLRVGWDWQSAVLGPGVRGSNSSPLQPLLPRLECELRVR